MLLKEFRSHAQALPDLLPWAALIDNGVVLTKSGVLVTLYIPLHTRLSKTT